jgi:hypothetical protein
MKRNNKVKPTAQRCQPDKKGHFHSKSKIGRQIGKTATRSVTPAD